jgi:hypothetical protein
MSGRGRLLLVGLVSAAVALVVFARPGWSEAHLFHKVYEPPETQLTRDARVLQLLLDDPSERFELARKVYAGEERVRLKPGGFRRWLTRPIEPGMVFKADYQLHRWSGSLQTEAARIDRERGTSLAERIDAGLALRDREGITAALREMFVVLLDELLESLWRGLDAPGSSSTLYAYALRYYSVNLEGHLNIHHPTAAPTARAALDAIGRASGDPETGAPSAPEAFDRQRRRFMRVLREAVLPVSAPPVTR